MAVDHAAQHWNLVFGTKDADEVSWYRDDVSTSLELLRDCPGSVVDVGAGASTLVDELLGSGRTDVTVLDVSDQALDISRRRLGARAESVSFVVADLLSWEPGRQFDAWHDRAVFHFLTHPAQQHLRVAGTS